MSDSDPNENGYRTWKRVTCFLILLITLFWGIWSIFATVPSTTLSLAYGDYHFFGLKLSRWLDFLAMPAWVSMVAVFFATVDFIDDRNVGGFGWKTIVAVFVFMVVTGLTFIISLVTIGLLPGLFVCLALLVVTTVMYFCIVTVVDFVTNIGEYLRAFHKLILP